MKKIKQLENNQRSCLANTTAKNTASEIAELEKKIEVKIRFLENLSEDGGDKYYILVESLKTGGKKKYSFETITQAVRDLMKQGHKVRRTSFEKLFNLVSGSEVGENTELDISMDDYIDGYFHNHIGWGQYKGTTTFAYENVYTENEVITSDYEGNVLIDKCGDMDTYIEDIKNLVVPYPKLMIVYVAGVSGMIAQQLNLADSNILLNICGESSCGKTTAENVAMSFWGNPLALSTTFNSTANRIEEIMSERMIMPVLVDDILAGHTYSSDKVKQKMINDAVFRYTSGKIKGRMGSAEKRHYGATITSSETSLFEKLAGSEADGHFYRMIELNVKKGELTENSEHAKKLEALYRNNYGVAVERFGQFLLTNGYTEKALLDYYNKVEKTIADDIRLTGKERIAKRLAILSLTAELINECFELKLNVDEFMSILFENVDAAFDISNQKIAAYKQITKLVNNNSDLFVSAPGLYETGKHLGVCVTNIFGHKEVNITTKIFPALIKGVPINQILNRSDMMQKVKQPRNTEVEEILKYWREKGWLNCCGSTQRLYRKIKMGTEKEVLVYTVILQD